MGSIDYSPLGRAIQRLREGLDALGREPENSLYRDAVIQRFEFTYGLCGSLLARYVARSSVAPAETEITFANLIRTASGRGLLRSGWDKWYAFREARNLTSHTYDDEKARLVMEKIPSFAEEAEFLYAELEKRSGEDGN